MEGEQRPANEGGGNGTGSDPNQVGAGPSTPPTAPTPLPPPPAPAYAAPQQPQYPPPPPQQPPYQPPPPPQPPYQPPAYQPPPQQGYATPGAPATYAPPAQPGYYQQPVQPGFAPPPARKGSRTLLIVAIVAVFLLVVLAGGGILANASLSSTYSPGKAVSNYLAAQARGDVTYMLANANYLKGDSGTDAFFGKDALTALMAISDNKNIRGVNVTGTEQLDSATSKVTVSMSWGGNPRTQTYTVHKDTSRQHFLLYDDWKLDVPASSVSFTLPNQAGTLQVDGIDVPSGTTSLAVIQGFHTVTMAKTDLYDVDNETANAVDSAASVTFAGKLSAAALSAAQGTVNRAFANITCDSAKFIDCPAHTYHPSAGQYDILQLPGGDINAYTSWVWSFTGDPTANMKLVPTTNAGEMKASGTCAMKLVVDGKSTYNFTGTWDGTVTISGGTASSDLLEACDSARS